MAFPLYVCKKCPPSSLERQTGTTDKPLCSVCKNPFELIQQPLACVKSSWRLVGYLWDGAILLIENEKGIQYRLAAKTLENVIYQRHIEVGVWFLREMLQGKRHWQLMILRVKR